MLSKLREKYAPSQLYYDIEKGQIDRVQIFDQKNWFLKLYSAVTQFIDSCIATDLPGVCAQMAFIILFALLPTLLFIILICTQFVPDFQSIFMAFIKTLTPAESFEYISTEIDFLMLYVSRLRYFITVLSAVMGTLSAHTILIALNQTYGFRPYSSAKWEWIKSFFMLLVLCLVLSFITITVLSAGTAAQKLAEAGPADLSEKTISYGFMGIFAVIGIFLILLGIYIFAPQRRITVRDALPGAITATVGILVVFQIYVRILNRSANYLTIYGSLSGLFILLTALFFLSAMIALGAKLNTFFASAKQDG